MVVESSDFFYSKDAIDFASCYTNLSCGHCNSVIGRSYKTANRRVEELRYS